MYYENQVNLLCSKVMLGALYVYTTGPTAAMISRLFGNKLDSLLLSSVYVLLKYRWVG